MSLVLICVVLGLSSIVIGPFWNFFIRGGYIKHFLPSIRNTKIMNTLLYALVCTASIYLVEREWSNLAYGLFFITFGAGMALGQAPALYDSDEEFAFRHRILWLWSENILVRAVWWVGFAQAPFWFFDKSNFIIFPISVAIFYYANYLCRWKSIKVFKLDDWASHELVYGIGLWLAPFFITIKYLIG